MRRNLTMVKTEGAPRFTAAGHGLHLNTQSGVYYVRKSFRRLRIPDLFETTGERTIGKARSKADTLIAEHQDFYLGNTANPRAKKSGKTFRDVIDEISSEAAKSKLRAKTKRKYLHMLRDIREEWGKQNIRTFSETRWLEWLPKYQARKKRKTFFDFAKFMNIIMRHAYDRRYVSHLVTVPNPDTKGEDTGRVYTDIEIARVYAAMNQDLKDQFLLCYECFMRLREALYLEWSRVDLATGTITLRAQDVKTGSKTGRGRAFIASPGARAALERRFSSQKGSSPYVFPGRGRIGKPQEQNQTGWELAKKRAGITGRARWHDLRHTALTNALLVKKVEPTLVSEFAGVSLATIQRVYLHSTAELTKSVSEAITIQRDFHVTSKTKETEDGET